MGHQLARAVTATAVATLLLSACGGGNDSADLPPVLDNAREAVAEAEQDDEPVVESAVEPDVVDIAELPAPDLSEYEGVNRVVNLWVGEAGETQTIDVWGRRTFTNGPILLADGLEFGAASAYFSAPQGYSLVVVGGGAGPDADELAGMFNAVDGEQITMIYTNDDEQGAVSAPNLWERDLDGRSGTPAPPQAGLGLVYLYAPNTRSFGDSLTSSVGSDSYYVGDGAGACRHQRVEDEGFQASVLGGTQNVQLDLPPGPNTITLHPWPSFDDCAGPTVLAIDVDVPADGSVMVLVYSADGRSLDTLQLPIT